MSSRPFFALLLALLFLPQISFGVTGEDLIPTLVTPSQSQSYRFQDHVVLTGTWQLPPEWAGLLEVYTDAEIDPYTKVPMTLGTLMIDIDTGRTGYLLNGGATSTATTSGSFVIDIGTQVPGAHNLYIKFWGGTECAVNQQLNARNEGGISNRLPVCSVTADNFAGNLAWPSREYSTDLPEWPVMVVTPSTSPAMDFANTTFGAKPTRTFRIENNGNGTLTGSIQTSLKQPFSCAPVCSYNINPGGFKDITITFAPTSSPASFSSDIVFSCDSYSSTYGCEGGAKATAFQTFQLVGNSVDGLMPPTISIDRTLYNYGQENIGVSAETVSVTVSNIGGGLLNGVVNFSGAPGEYTCLGNPTCSYSLFAGDPKTITIQYLPSVASPSRSDTAVFSGGAGSTLTLQSAVNDLPIAALYYTPSISFTGTLPNGDVNVGTCVQRDEYVRNSGAGLLSGSVTGVPIDIGGTLKLPGFSCISPNCAYSNLPNTNNWNWYYLQFQFCPSSAGAASAKAIFSNSGNYNASSTVTLSGNGNVTSWPWWASNSLTFQDTLINTTRQMTLTISNIGADNLSGSAGSALNFPSVFKCMNAGEYDTGANCQFVIPKGKQTVLTFSFTPGAVQTYNDTIVVSGVGTLSLRGSGVQPNFKVSYVGYPDLAPTPPSSILPPSPKSYDVGTTTYGGSATIQNKKFYLYTKNMGSGASVNYTFNNVGPFICLGGAVYGCTGALPAGSQDTIVYEYQPSAAGDFTKSILVDYDYGDGDYKQLQLDVTGHSASAPYLFVTPLVNQNLGDIAVGATSSAFFTVSNLGIGALDYTVSIPSLVSTDPLSGLISRWTFDTANINWPTHSVVDVAGGGNTAYLPGPISATGKYGQALNFMGSGAVKRGSITGLSTGSAVLHTTAMWMKINALPPSARSWIAVLGQWGNGSEHLLLRSSGIVEFGVWGYGSQQCSPNLSGYVGSWVHVALVHDGSNLKCYVNGTLHTTVAAGNYYFSNSALSLGDGRSWGEYDFNGLIDDVRVYNRALSTAEIGQVYTNSLSPSGLQLRYSFDDPTVVWSQLKVVDVTGKGNDGALVSVPMTVTGKLGQAMYFDGSFWNYIHVPISTNLNPASSPFSIGLWFKTNSFGTLNGSILYNKEDLYEASAGGGYFTYAWQPHWNWDGDSSFPINVGEWYHAVVVYDGLNQYLYKNGVLVYSRPQSGGMGSNSNRFALGTRGYFGGGNSPFNGAIDDVRVYNRALSATEAEDLFKSGISSGVANFTCVSNCADTLPSTNDSKTVQIDFTPTQAIGYIAYPLFTSPDGGNVGYPAAPYPSISGVGVLNPMIDVTPGTLSFPVTNLGLSTRMNLSITNIGLGDLSGNVSPVRTGGLPFYCFSNCNYNLTPGASTTAIIEFSPNATGTAASMITLTSNAVNSPTLTVPVFGEGKFAPIIDPRGGDTNYGKVVITKRKSQTFTLDNSNSTADLGSGTFVVTGPFKCTSSVDGFDVNGDCIYNLPAGGIATITITFSPIVVGGLPATSVNSGSVWLSGVPLARFFVQGIGVPPTVKFIEE